MPGKSAFALVLIGSALVVCVAACGSDDDSSAGGEATTQVTEPTTTEETTTEETTTDETTTGNDDGEAQELEGETGPGFEIKLRQDGEDVESIPAGTYTVSVEDQSEMHNFHLIGTWGRRGDHGCPLRWREVGHRDTRAGYVHVPVRSARRANERHLHRYLSYRIRAPSALAASSTARIAWLTL